jgi:hypothetical protein
MKIHAKWGDCYYGKQGHPQNIFFYIFGMDKPNAYTKCKYRETNPADNPKEKWQTENRAHVVYSHKYQSNYL